MRPYLIGFASKPKTKEGSHKTMKRLILILALLTPATALAQPVEAVDAAVAAPAETPDVAAPAPLPVPEEPGEVVEVASDLLSAAKSGQWTLVFVLAIMILVYAARTLAGKVAKLRWLDSKWGGWTLVLAGTVAGTVAAALQAGDGVSWSLISSAITMGLAAAGGHELHGDSGLKGA